ncbi:nucleoside-diphosphate sugar epimerase/dehydratase [Burkholderia stabilis]|uniref:UDP-glucose 4-epimerase,UDP-galactose-4-epimerase,UDP-N-acetylglucosa mine 4,6-dehydratase,Polysaccharide biosynthesis protein n=2 Tax=Burkholderia cepacia complex TaxID=87882 RepID=A0AAJ5N4S3_9BURK|nr:nucleoside-diphosphate sugar epimerase/dehydratase [Burkholderia stabilis]VBB11483.1 UDP-glucose 4-epimerase,UDP-galactose-4-epimerase,UDP-N-acetylglucosa mine 4,6-dehydratase,Polysaccharide biosynthesis protein [Burkholderia stabilis]HDR9492551.1 polysaccharide biosynthesis protein [Burkholderia stabilis]HDR9530365.1 polysaccharide biosynthesis protein [Burkholderia stabilis]HDR9539300.1 polysaccharide biosynthesis protein [Burkholderia stabilis]HDR9548186.1 polysaccharide biosynthesis pro
MFRFKASWQSLSAFLFDLIAVAGAWLTAYVVRFNGSVPADFLTGAFDALAWVLPIYGLMFHCFGLYRGLWVFASLPDLLRISKAVIGGGLIVMIGAVMLQPTPIIPRSALVLSPVLLFLAMGGARALYRASKEFYLYGGLVGKGKPVLVLGAGTAGASLARELSRSGEWRLVGLLDDDPAKRGREIYGYKVLGAIGELNHWAEFTKAEHAIIALPSTPVEVQRRVATQCVRAGVKAMVLPALTALMPGQGFLSQVRNIDLEDLLGRDAVTIDTPHVEALLHGRVVMVTGAGGSIGSELCRQILRFSPAQLIAFDLSEYAMYRLTEELRERFPDQQVVPIIGDAKDSLLLDQLMSRYAPHIVFHAAAYKHVPLMEEHNAWQALRNNVLGTYRVARAAIRHDVRHFVLISTDKAVNPTNVMGASKRLAEMACQALQQTSQRTQFETVRFGNVLGSAGSVIPKFQQQISKGGPVTVTHPEITRFFMTIPEASQLVLQASSMGRGGEIFILDMGQPVKIVDLARDLIRLYGFSEEQIRIEFTGLRPGEKLYEELLADDETTTRTPHPKLRIARAREVPDNLLDELLPWLMQHRVLSDDEVRRDLRRWVSEYQSSSAPVLHSVPARAASRI